MLTALARIVQVLVAALTVQLATVAAFTIATRRPPPQPRPPLLVQVRGLPAADERMACPQLDYAIALRAWRDRTSTPWPAITWTSQGVPVVIAAPPVRRKDPA